MISPALRAGLGASALLLSSGALAQQVPAPQPAVPGEAAATESPILTIEELAQLRGGETIVINNQTLAGLTTGTLLGDYTAGSINLSDNALSNFNGVGNVVVNTGALNTLQAGMTLTINIAE